MRRGTIVNLATLALVVVVSVLVRLLGLSPVQTLALAVLIVTLWAYTRITGLERRIEELENR